MEDLEGQKMQGLELGIVDESVTTSRVSVQKLSSELQASESTVLRSMQELGGEYLPVQRQPHVLKQFDKSRRVVLAAQLHRRLLAKNTWPRIITGDEAWVYLRNDSTAEWGVSLGQEECKDRTRTWRFENHANCLLVYERISPVAFCSFRDKDWFCVLLPASSRSPCCASRNSCRKAVDSHRQCTIPQCKNHSNHHPRSGLLASSTSSLFS